MIPFFAVRTAALFGLLSVLPLVAQTIEPGRPAQAKVAEAQPAEPSPAQRFSLGNVTRMHLGPIADSERDRPAPMRGVARIGTTRNMQVGSAQGAWQLTPDGGRVWRFRVQSTGALALRVHFQQFSVGAGKVWVHDTATPPRQSFGPYTSRGRNGTGDFWTEAVFSDTLEVEYQPASSASTGTALPFQLAELSHIWQVGPYAAPRQNGSDQSSGLTLTDGGEDRVLAGNFVPERNNSCFLDATCYLNQGSVASASRATAFLIVGNFSCTGTILNAPNQFPVLLTAGHCVQNQAGAQQLLAFFNFRTGACGQDVNAAVTDAALAALPQIAGISLLSAVNRPFTNASTPGQVQNDIDYALVLLAGFPSDPSLLLAGYSVADLAANQPVISVSNPNNGYMKVAFGTRVDSAADDPTNYFVNAWEVDQSTAGRIDAGSSGSGIFDANGHLVGSLSTGYADCQNPDPQGNCPAGSTACDAGATFRAWYTKFSSVYPLIRNSLLLPITSTPGVVNQGSFTASPNPIPLSSYSGAGQVTLNWDVSSVFGVTSTEIHVGDPAGPVFARGGTRGSAQTGNWVRNGMVFYLNNTTSQAASYGNVLATVTVIVGDNATTSSATGFSANPSSLFLPAGVSVGHTTLTWNEPGVQSVEIHVNSPTGPLFAAGSPSGQSTTGDWVVPGMTFYLIDTSPGAGSRIIASVKIGSGQDGGTVESGVASLVLTPNPIVLSNTNNLPQTTVSWNTLGTAQQVEVHLFSPAGPLFARGDALGSATTGPWVSTGLVFYLQDVTGGKPLTAANTLTTAVAAVSQ